MRCIFCKQDSSNSKSVEHIIPESLGGTKHILDKGIICDKCNNYFSREVEKPFLEAFPTKLLRSEQFIPSKKGNIPPVDAIINRKHIVPFYPKTKEKIKGEFKVPPDVFQEILESKQGTILIPKFQDGFETLDGNILSRFIGKIAIEAFAQKILSVNRKLIDDFIDDEQFSLLRNHVRRGSNLQWLCNIRTIYDSNKLWFDEETSEYYQKVNEYDFLLTDRSECYFVVAIFGMEFVINMGGPSIEGYIEWLDHNKSKSPLYTKE